ncbi:peptidylglycine alpha-hydroxylating monooxygenase [Patella vulgata]|uniref:peptidylglycine alpha-hydroxylating monooxygenase n=1 Tax=Patella vulgata TaxID=6465 RepID=UPI00217F6F5D|nr:peptidylglycine alpha-hydroxylating monooxygenase [Patella vulgata]XP_050401262.1 peptidylglycine alpha-hydroxylating monooxygenase [Patella vulgata]
MGAMILLIVALISGCLANGGQLDLRMPNVKPQHKDTYLCFTTKLNNSLYITGFEPHAKMQTAHHMLLYGCKSPGKQDKVWNCGEMAASANSKYSSGPTCSSGTKIIFGWAMDAPSLVLPKDVAFKVGGDSDVDYLVLQVHYKDVSKFLPPSKETDSSGLTLTTTTTPLPKTAGIYLLGSSGTLPRNSVEYMETACKFDEDVTIHPMSFRTHTHALGRVVSGYRIRDGEWTEIGRKSPQKPQTFYNATTPNISVKKGDILAARCTYENTKDHPVNIGPTADDEMCNFYMMYYVDGDKTAERKYCFNSGPPYYSWDNFDEGDMNLEAIPETASTDPEGKKWTRTGDSTDEQWGEQSMDERDTDDLLSYIRYLASLTPNRESQDLYDNY